MRGKAIESALREGPARARSRAGRGGGLDKATVLRWLRTLHGWLGIFIFPWIIILGLTGFYLNHWQLVLGLIEPAPYDESRFDEWPASAPVTLESARAVARGVWPDEPIRREREVTYLKRPAFEFKKDSGYVIVTRPSGHYFVKTRLRRRTHAPDGTLLHSKIYWGPLFKRLHETGWIDRRLGTWLADITALAMVFFGLSGMVLWTMPRLARLRRRGAGR